VGSNECLDVGRPIARHTIDANHGEFSSLREPIDLPTTHVEQRSDL